MRTLILVAAAGLAACGAPAPDAPESALTLRVTGSETGPDGAVCAFDVAVSNALGHDAANVQVAYTARTQASGAVSEYVVLGDFAAGATRTGRLFVTGAPCAEVATLELTRAVCTVSPVTEPAASCADSVWLDGGGVVEVVRDE